MISHVELERSPLIICFKKVVFVKVLLPFGIAVDIAYSLRLVNALVLPHTEKLVVLCGKRHSHGAHQYRYQHLFQRKITLEKTLYAERLVPSYYHSYREQYQVEHHRSKLRSENRVLINDKKPHARKYMRDYPQDSSKNARFHDISLFKPHHRTRQSSNISHNADQNKHNPYYSSHKLSISSLKFFIITSQR